MKQFLLSILLAFALLLGSMTSSFAQSTKTTYDFSTAATLSFGSGGFGIWKTQADITIAGTAFRLTCGGNGSFANLTNGGVSNSACLQKDGSGGDQFTLQRTDGQPFQFYGIWVKHQSMNSYYQYVSLPPWYTLTASTFSYQDNTARVSNTGNTLSTQTISAGTNGVTTSSVSISFQAILYFWIDDIIVGPAPASASLSTITTQAVSGISTTTATGNGNITATGGANITERGIYYSTTSGFANGTGTKVSTAGSWSTTGAFTQSITGLSPGTTYYVKAFATNSAGTSYGAQVSFTTSVVAPTATTNAATGITTTGVTLNGTVNPNNATSVVTFDYGTSTSYGSSATASQSPVTGTSATSVSSVLTGLTPNSTYHFRVKAVNTAGTTYGSDLTFTTLPVAPTVTGISPTSGPATGGTSVIITGTNLTGASAVKFGANNATNVTVNSATQITAISPAGSTGTIDVTVTTTGGTSATSSSDQYTYIAAPTVSGISPTNGPIAGGTSVIITGTNLTDATAVKFGSANASSYTVNSATQITATSPTGTAGTVDITVTTTGGTSVTNTSDQFSYVGPPTFNTTPSVITVDYGTPYSYGATATVEGDLPTTITATTLPDWLTFSTAGQSTASLFGNIPTGTLISGVAGDNDGNIFGITQNGTTIYKISPDGTTTTWKSGLPSGNVYALHICDGYIYIPRYLDGTNSIYRVPLNDASATAESMGGTSSDGALSLTDRGNYIYATGISRREIYKIDKTSKVSTLFLTTKIGSYPFGITFDLSGNLFIASWSYNEILKYDGTQTTTILTGLNNSPSSIRTDKDGNFYISGNSGGVRKYKPDFSSYVNVSNTATDNVWSLSFTTNGSLVYAIFSTNQVYRLQTGAVIQGTPAKTDVGVHPVVLRATNSAGYNEQSFSITVEDNAGPVITSKSPSNNATGVAFQPTLSMTFDEEVSLGATGIIGLYNGATLIKSYDLSVPAEKALVLLSSDNKTLSVALTENLSVNTLVSVGIDAGFVKDVHNNNFIGFTAASNTWRFTTINKSTQTITFPDMATKTYGDAAFTLGNSTTDRNLTVTYTAEDTTVVSIYGNLATILKAGSTKITATQTGDNSNFAATPVERTLNVTKALLTVTAEAQTKVYGATNPTLTFQYSGWVNGVETIDTPPTISTTVDGTTEVGSYANAITLSGGTDNNYTFSLVAGDFEVTKAVLTATADDQTKVYGATNPTLTFQYSGWVNGTETIDTPPTISTTVDGTTEVGSYANAITLSGGTDNNYTFSLVAGDFEVTKAVLTATADDQTKVYGSANPTLTFQYSGWVNGVETIDTPPAISTTVDGTTEVGSYANAITLSGGTDNNYTFSLVPGDFEVTKAVLTATADDQSKVYGATNPTLTFQYSGWVNGTETIDTPPTISTTVDAASVVGTYSNEITLTGGTDNNYTFSLVTGDFEVTKAVLTATADDQTKVYGAANPTLTFQYSGWVNGVETIDTPPAISTTVDGTTEVGSYANAIQLSGGTDNNYTFSLVSGDFEVTKAVLTVTADDQTKVYGSTNPTLTFQYSGWVNGTETIDTPPTISTTVDGTTEVGSYANAITLSGGTDNNYTFSLVSGDFEVTKAVLTATADDQTKVYGSANPTLTFQYSGWVNGVETIDTPPTISTTVDAATEVGSYANSITLSGGTDNNYTFSLVSGDFEVTKAVLTATADNQTKVYGASNPTLTFQYSGWVNGTETIDTPPTIATTVDGTSVVGTYSNAITLTGGTDNNYTFSLVAGDFEVTKAVLTATADDQTKVYGAANPTLTFQYSGWVNGTETIDTPPTISTTVDGTTEVGSYANAITLSGGTDNNYSFSLVFGDFEVTKAVLTATADDQTKVYGDVNDVLTFRYSGWQNSDDETVLDTKPTASTTVDLLTNVGTHVGSITVAGGADNNYDFTYVPADYEVTRAMLTATAD
ncbi:MAG: MBG domain-containing protein, partial [Prolixibacteraceae bacterium]